MTPSAFVFSPNIRTMNKNFIVTGTVKFYGKVRSTTTRLHSEVYPNQELFFVAPNLDWKKGDEIALTASNRNIVSYETATILDYLPGNGQVTLTEKLKHYHFGSDQSTAEQYKCGEVGVDIRGEVLLLSRDITIVGSTDYNSTLP